MGNAKNVGYIVSMALLSRPCEIKNSWELIGPSACENAHAHIRSHGTQKPPSYAKITSESD